MNTVDVICGDTTWTVPSLGAVQRASQADASAAIREAKGILWHASQVIFERLGAAHISYGPRLEFEAEPSGPSRQTLTEAAVQPLRAHVAGLETAYRRLCGV